LLTKYTTPEELFGPYSLAALERDEYIRKTEHNASEAHFIFLDEIWKANSGVLNANLTLITERLFYNGAVPVKVPLLTLVGASNELPEEDDNLDAMLDRFILKYHVKPIVEEQNFMQMLIGEIPETIEPMLTLNDITVLQVATKAVKMPKEMLELYASLRRDFSANGLVSSDRTYRNTIDILKAEALFKGRDEVIEDDFEVLRHALWADPKNESSIYNTILAEINPDKNKVVELYEDCKTLYEDLMAEKDQAKRLKEGVEVAMKLKEAKIKIHEFFKEMKKKNKDIADIVKMEESVAKYLTTVYNEACGIKF
jgi:MoxR-like ATPase